MILKIKCEVLQMNDYKLLNLLQQVGLRVDEVKPHVFKGNAGNVKQWHTFRIWLNKSNKVTIRTRNVQKSFDIQNRHQLLRALRGFDLL
jgi:hypothetical protein